MSVVMETWLPRHRFDVDEYHRMREFGILKPKACVELIEGSLVCPLRSAWSVDSRWRAWTVTLLPIAERRPIHGSFLNRQAGHSRTRRVAGCKGRSVRFIRM